MGIPTVLSEDTQARYHLQYWKSHSGMEHRGKEAFRVPRQLLTETSPFPSGQLEHTKKEAEEAVQRAQAIREARFNSDDQFGEMVQSLLETAIRAGGLGKQLQRLALVHSMG